jgi:xanthine dehydrogenase accessory factor
MVCPIGLPGIPGKQPGVIALSVAAQVLEAAAAIAPLMRIPSIDS